MACVSLGGR